MKSAALQNPTESLPALNFALDPSFTFLNHGSYGAAPHAVLDYQREVRARMEREPVRFFKVDLENLLDEVRVAIGNFVNCPAHCIAPTPNATLGIATVLANTPIKAGDEILVTTHEYGSGLNELERICQRTGAKLVKAFIPFPITSPAVARDAVLELISARTRLIIISQVTSCTSLILPVEDIVPVARARGIDILVDGAHSPGQIPVDIMKLNPTYYVGSMHKWTSAPKGTAFLYVEPSRLEGFRPVWLSSRANKIRPERALFLRDFDYIGTVDYSAILSIPKAIETMASLMPGGWPALMAANHQLALQGRQIVLEALKKFQKLDAAVGASPAPDKMIGSMATVVLPEAPKAKENRPTIYDDPLQDELVHNHRIITPIWRLNEPNRRVLRLSAQIYNTLDQYHLLAQALTTELEREQA